VYAAQINQLSFFKKIGMAGKIRAEFQAAVDANPNSFEAHYALMSFYAEAPGMAGGDSKKAAAEQAVVARLKPAWGFLAQYDLTPKEKRASVQEDLYRKAHDAAGPADYQDMQPYCSFLAGAKRWAEAQKCAEDLVKRAPDRVWGYSVLAVTFASQARWPELDRAIAEAEKNVPDNLNPEFQAARVLIENGGDAARAEKYLRHYLEQEPEAGFPKVSRARYRLGQALARQGKNDQARTELQAAIQLEPDFKPAKDELSKLK
jgi:tetratricopeptide (TPR) repeat protein